MVNVSSARSQSTSTAGQNHSLNPSHHSGGFHCETKDTKRVDHAHDDLLQKTHLSAGVNTKTMTTETTRTRHGNGTVLTSPPPFTYPQIWSKDSTPLLPLPSIGEQRRRNGWPDWPPTSAPPHLIHRSYNADLQLPPGWPPALEWRPPYGSVIRSQLPPSRSPKFDPRSMIWWSQWEIVFAKKVIGLSDADTCALFRFRWQATERSTRYMKPYHVREIMDILDDGHPWHTHAFRWGTPGTEGEICKEFLQDLRMARQLEQSLYV